MVIVCCLAFSGIGAAEVTSNSVLNKRAIFYGGIQYHQADGKFASYEPGEPDIKVDFDDLGLNENEVSASAGAIFNFWSKRMTLRLDYYGYHDDAKATADFTFDFDGITFPAGARLDSNFDLDVYVVNLSYNFIRSDRAQLGVGLGVHAADIDVGISGTVEVAGETVDLGSGDADVLAPLPNFYITGAYAFTDNFLIRAGGGGLSLSYGDWDGQMWFVNAFLEYWPWQHVGFGAGLRYFGVDVDYDGSKYKEEYNFDLPGPVFYVTAGF
jgi:hypothetical protein